MDKLKTNSLTVRIFSAIVYAIVFAFSLIHKYTFIAVFVFFMAQSLWEFYRLTEKNHSKPKKIFGIIVAILIFVFLFLYKTAIFTVFPIVLVISLIFISLIIELFRKNINTINTISSEIFGIFYIAIPFSLTNLLVFRDGKFDYSLLLSIFIFIWFFDMFAYFTGVLIGKHKIAPNISPKKTIEGTIGGFIFSTAMAIPVYYVFRKLSLENYIVIAILVSIGAFVGDLFESKIKRIADVKDSGTIMPGHGGLLDRFDSFIFSIIFATVYLFLIKLI